MAGSPPPAPDYTGAAEATADASREVTEQQTWANRPDQFNPFGSLTYEATPTYDETTGRSYNRWTQTQSLNPNLQAALDSQIDLQRGRSDLGAGMLGRIGGELGQPMDFAQYGSMQGPVAAEAINTGDLPEAVAGITPSTYNNYQLQKSVNIDDAYDVADPQRYIDEAGDALYQRATNRLDPRFAQQRNDLDVQLRSQGLAPGDEAYDRAIGNLDRAETDAYEQAQLQATQFAGQEGSRYLQDDMARRAMDVGEQFQLGEFANRATGSQSGIDLATGGREFQEQQAAAGFANAARAQALQEQTALKDRAFTQANQNVQDFNNIRMAAMQEEMMRRGFSLNEANALIQGQQVQTPNMAPVQMASRAQGADYMGAATAQYDAALDRFNAQQAGIQGLLSGGVGLAGAAAGFF